MQVNGRNCVVLCKMFKIESVSNIFNISELRRKPRDKCFTVNLCFKNINCLNHEKDFINISTLESRISKIANKSTTRTLLYRTDALIPCSKKCTYIPFNKKNVPLIKNCSVFNIACLCLNDRKS